MNEMKLTARRPYMLRAFYDWLVDNELTPHIVVDATLPYVDVPTEYVKDGQIVLNIAPTAVGDLDLGNEDVFFNARFGGRPMSITVPLYAITAIYARENGAGTMFDSESAYQEELEAIATDKVHRRSMAQEALEENADSQNQEKKDSKERPSWLTVVK